jgi:hypothetical protein
VPGFSWTKRYPPGGADQDLRPIPMLVLTTSEADEDIIDIRQIADFFVRVDKLGRAPGERDTRPPRAAGGLTSARRDPPVVARREDRR